jgi:hypothetical protein
VTTTHPANELNGATWLAASLEQVEASVSGDAIKLHIVASR